MFNPVNESSQVYKGVLTVTTFKLSFASAEESESKANCYQQNLLLGVSAFCTQFHLTNRVKKCFQINDVCLSSIDCIYLGDKSKKKLLVPGQNVSGKVKELLIVCKVGYSMFVQFET